jgi:hypothetical protein
MTAPDRYVEWINQHLGFNPRSGGPHSQILSSLIHDDLVAACPEFRLACEGFGQPYRLDVHVPNPHRGMTRTIDYVHPGDGLIRLSIENKTLMTAFGKARKNRYGDLQAYFGHMHEIERRTIVAGTLVINIAPEYQNPDWKESPNIHRKIAKTVLDTVQMFSAFLPLRNHTLNLDAKAEAFCVIVINYDGRNPATLHRDEPAPQQGDPFHYESLLSLICRHYGARFAKQA